MGDGLNQSWILLPDERLCVFDADQIRFIAGWRRTGPRTVRMLMQIRVWNPDGTWMNSFSFHECDDVEFDELFEIDCALEFDAAELTVGVTVRPAARGGFDVTVDTPDGWSVSRESDLP